MQVASSTVAQYIKAQKTTFLIPSLKIDPFTDCLQSQESCPGSTMNSVLAMNIRIEMTQMNDKNSKQVVSSKLKNCQ